MNYTGIFGFDISTYQDAPTTPAVVDFRKMRDYGASFVIVKAGQGNWEDPDFKTSWQNAKGILPRASYWYYDNRYPPKDQARKYYDIIRKDLEGMCWLDLEDKTAGVYAGWRNWFDFLEELRLLYPGAQIGIYTGFFYIVDMFAYATRLQREYFAQYPLWLANYGAAGSDPFHPNYNGVLIPLPWLEYLILQSGTPAIGEAVGVESKDIDYNQFNGDAEKFRQYFGSLSAELPTDEETENPMTTYIGTVLATVTLQIRSGPGTSYPDIGDLHYGDQLEASEIIGGWWKLTKVNGVAASGYSYSNNGAYIRTDAVVTEPPTEGGKVAFTLTVDGFKPYSGELEKA